VSILLERAAHYKPAVIPESGRTVSIFLSLVTISVIVACLSTRLAGQQSWRNNHLTRWLVLAIYIDSFLFVFTTAIISQGVGLNNSLTVCSVAVELCLVFYMTTKVMLYLFLVERARIVRGTRKPRTKDRLYLFNFFGMLIPYGIVIVLNLLYRFALINNKGMCIIGIKLIAIIPLVSFDVIVNVYLTILFLVPLWGLYSFRNKLNLALRRTALHAFIGSCVTLTSSVANLLTIMILKGEPGYICLMCCNADILFSVLVLHWMTSRDQDHPPTTVGQETPPARPHLISRSSGRLPTRSSGRLPKRPEAFDLEYTIDEPDIKRASRGRDGIISTVVSEENRPYIVSDGREGESTDGSPARSSDEGSKGGITKRTSLTIESSRDEESLRDKESISDNTTKV